MKGKPNNREKLEIALAKSHKSNGLLQALLIKYIAHVIAVHGNSGMMRLDAVKEDFFNEQEINLINNLTNESIKVLDKEDEEA